jgi:hypothetical protein
LNADLSDQARLNPDNYKSVLSEQEYQQAKFYASESTGFNDPNAGVSDLEKARCAISKNESGSCGGNYGTVGPPTRSGGRAYGRYQVMDFNIGPWSASACGVRMTPNQFLNSPDCQDKVFDQQFGSYMQQCGFAGAAAKWFSGRCTVGSGGDGYTSIGRYVAKALGTYNGTSFPFGSGNSIYSSGTSPFGQVNPFYPQDNQVACTSYGTCYLASTPYTNSAYYGSAPVGVPTSGPSLTGGGSPISAGGPAQTPIQTPAQPLQPAPSGPPPAPVATLIVQPQAVVHGSSFTISWSSIGMRADQPCRILLNATSTPSLLAQANDGSKTIVVNTPGSIRVDMVCAASAGQTVSKNATVTVQ